MNATILVTIVLLFLASSSASAQGHAPAKVNADAAISAQFDRHVAEYMKLRQKVQRGLSVPKGTESADKITEYQRGLAERIRAARPQAKEGDIFTPQIVALFRKLITDSMDGPDGAKIRTSYERAEPIRGVHLAVDQAYPDGLPLQSMPPSLLLNLPRLPKELEYRFVDHELVLRDVAANLIVDLIPALTTPAKQ